ALNVIAAGHSLIAYARGEGQREIVGKGGVLTSSYLEVGRNCDVLCLCVFKDAQVQEVLLENGVLAALRPGTVVAIHTTGSPALIRSLAEAAPVGVQVLDATFSGDPGKARAGTLTLMIGGAAQAIEQARPVLESYATRIHHAGPLGAGQ